MPISEQVPPRIDRNDSGINSREGEIRRLRHQAISTGTSRATLGVLFSTMAEGISTTAMENRARPSVSTRPRNRSPTNSITPVSRSPAATTNIAATISIPELANPENASSGEITPKAARSTTAPTKSRSAGRSLTRP